MSPSTAGAYRKQRLGSDPGASSTWRRSSGGAAAATANHLAAVAATAAAAMDASGHSQTKLKGATSSPQSAPRQRRNSIGATPFRSSSGGGSPFGSASPALGSASPALGSASPGFGWASPALGSASPALGLPSHPRGDRRTLSAPGTPVPGRHSEGPMPGHLAAAAAAAAAARRSEGGRPHGNARYDPAEPSPLVHPSAEADSRVDARDVTMQVQRHLPAPPMPAPLTPSLAHASVGACAPPPKMCSTPLVQPTTATAASGMRTSSSRASLASPRPPAGSAAQTGR